MAPIEPSLHKSPEHDAQRRRLFGTVLRSFRTQRGLTQEELASRCEMDRSFISDLERGAREPGLFTVMRLAQGLDMPAAEIIGAFEAKTKTADI